LTRALDHDKPWYNAGMTPALEEAVERLRQMSAERQDAFARMLLREIVADEQWIKSSAHYAQWQQRRAENTGENNGRSPQAPEGAPG
jgi:hypothetical protein